MKVGLIDINARISELETLYNEFVEHKYTRPEHFLSHIGTNLGILKKTKQGYEYELQANLDHMTSEKENG